MSLSHAENWWRHQSDAQRGYYMGFAMVHRLYRESDPPDERDARAAYRAWRYRNGLPIETGRAE